MLAMMRVGGRRKGDTMIEVLLAVTVFSIVAVSGLTIMNQGAAAAQRSLEITLVRQQMDAQAETLRFMYDAALAQKSSGTTPPAGSAAAKWNQVLAQRKTSASTFSSMTTGPRCTAYTGTPIGTFNVSRGFVVNPRTASIYLPNASTWREAETYSRVRYASPSDPSLVRVEGLWVEAVQRNAETVGGVTLPGYTDFHIRACWAVLGQAQPATLGTIVRLYEP